jgi:hypothetical protein
LFSGYPLSEEARRFALQWGIIVIEPERMPLLLLHRFAGLRVPCLAPPAVEMQDQIWEEIPRIVVPLQERMQRLVALLGDDEPLVSSLRIERLLEAYQLQCGDMYWAALDDVVPGWLEDAYDALRLEDF